MYSTFGHHPHPLGYLCDEFRYTTAPIAELARGEKLHIQSITHSVTHSSSLFDALGTEVKASGHAASLLSIT